MKIVSTSALLCLVLSLSACQHVHHESHDSASNASDVKFWHVVIVKLNNPGDPDAHRRIIEASRSFQQIPGVSRVYVGRGVAGTRPNIPPSFDIAIMVGFKSKEDMAGYVANPIHTRAATEVLKPLAKEFSFYDFTNE
jgi:hypothetical protein